MQSFFQFVLNGALTGLAYALVALSFVMVYRASGIFNLAQGGLIMFGGYLFWWFAVPLGLGPWLGLLLAMLAGVVVGLGLERAIFRRMVGQNTFSLIMVTLGLMVLLNGVVLLIWGGAIRAFPPVMAGPAVHVGPFAFSRSLLIGGLTALFIIVVMWQLFERTVWGLRLTAVAESHVIAQAMGISPQTAIAISWGAAMALSTWGAVVLMDGRSLTFLISEVGLKVMVLPLLSGMESIPGLILSGLIVGMGEALAGAYLDPLTRGGMSILFPYMLMLVGLLIRPQGFFGWKIIERV